MQEIIFVNDKNAPETVTKNGLNLKLHCKSVLFFTKYSIFIVDVKSGRFMYQSGRAGDEAKKHKSPAKSGRVGINGSGTSSGGGGGTGTGTLLVLCFAGLLNLQFFAIATTYTG